MNRKILLSLIWLSITVPFYTYLSYLISANSDNMSALLIAKDIAYGNHRLDGWSLSTQSYIFSDIIWAVIAIKIFGYHAMIAHVLPAFMYSSMVLLLLKMSTQINSRGWVWLLPTMVFPSVFSGAVSFELCIHGGIYLLAVIFIYYLNKVQFKPSLTAMAAISLTSGVVIDSDKLFLYIFTIPLLLSSIFHAAIYRDKSLFRVAFIGVASILIYKLVSHIFSGYFLYTVPGLNPPQIASLDVFKNNLSLFWDGLRHLFGFTYSDGGINITFFVFKFIFCIVFLIISIIFIIKGAFRSFIDCFLSVSSGIAVCAFLFSNVPTDYYSARFFYCSLMFCSLLISRHVKIAPPAFIVFSLVVCSVGNLYDYSKIKNSKDSFYNGLSKYLKDRDLKFGYAPYWEASVLSAHGNLSVLPVDVKDTLTPKHWLSKKYDYDKPRNFFLSSDEKSIAVAISQFGKPDESYSFGEVKILKWDSMPLAPNGIIVKSFSKSTSTEVGSFRDGSINGTGKQGWLIYGPYTPINKGTYKFSVKGFGASKGDYIEIIDNQKNTTLLKSDLFFNDAGEYTAEVYAQENFNSIEIRVRTEGNQNISLRGYSLIKM